MGALVQLFDLHKIYDGGAAPVQALRSVSLTIAEGEYLAITGPSGSGKTTLLNIIGGLDKPTAGRCLVAGVDLATLDDRGLTRHRRSFVGFVFQAYNLISDMSVVDNVGLPLRYSRAPRKEWLTRAIEALQWVGLVERADSYPAELSGGEQQRAAIARALVRRPSLVLADEPTGNVDSATQEQILDIFDSIHKEGRTVIVVTHNPVVADRAKRVVKMVDGQIADS